MKSIWFMTKSTAALHLKNLTPLPKPMPKNVRVVFRHYENPNRLKALRNFRTMMVMPETEPQQLFFALTPQSRRPPLRIHCDGIHVPSFALRFPALAGWGIHGRTRTLSVAVHSLDEWRRARRTRCNFALLSPIRQTNKRPIMNSIVLVTILRAKTKIAPIALGGMTLRTVRKHPHAKKWTGVAMQSPFYRL